MTRSMNFDVTARDSASAEFRSIADQVERLEDRLKALDRLRVEPSIQANITPATRSVQQLQTRLDALRNVRAQVQVDGAAEARQDVTALVVEMRKVRDVRAKLELQTGTAKADVTTIAAKLAALRDTNVTVDVRTGQAETRTTSIETRLTALRALSPVSIEVRVDEQDRAMTRIQALILAARGLAAQRPNIQVTADTAAALAQLSVLLARVQALSNAQHTVRVSLEGQSLLAQLASIQTQLNTLAGGSVEITADTRALMTELAEARVELARLEAMAPTVVVQADTELARHRIEQLERRLHDIAAEQYTAEVDVDRNGSALAKMVALSGASGILVASLGAGTAAAATLAGSLVGVGGAAPVAVGGLMSVVAVVGAYRVGVMGLDEALSNLDDPEKLAAALERLSPAAREFVRSVQQVRPEFDRMQLGVQERLFAGMGDQVELLGDRLLPSMSTGLGNVAGELNMTGKELVEFVTSAGNVRDIDEIFTNTTAAMTAARPAALNVAAALTDVGVVGSSMLPELADGWTEVTNRFRVYIAEGRRTGELEAQMRRGIETVQTLGSVLGNVGGIAGGVFDAADASGADFLTTLDRVTGGVERYINSTQGQTALIDFFRESRDVVDELTPGISALGTETGRATSAFANTGGAERFAAATSNILQTASPLLPVLGQLGGETLGNVASGLDLAADLTSPLVTGLSGILQFAGPVTPAVLAMMAAFAGGIAARAAVLGLSGAMATAATTAGTYVLGMTGSAAAGQAVATAAGAGATAVGAVARALPIAAVAAVGFGMALDSMSASTDDATAAMGQGGIAADLMRARLAEQTGQAAAGRSAFDDWAVGINEWVNVNLFGIASTESATQAFNEQRASMTSLQLAQQDASIAQGEYAEKVKLFTENSPQARAALEDLNAKTREVELAQRAARDGTDLHTAAMRMQADQALAAIDAGRGYAGALLNLERAQQRAAAATRDHGAGSLEAREANYALEGQFLATAAAAGEKAQADAEARGASNAAEIGAQAHRAELIRLAAQASGPTRQALLDAAAALDVQTSAASRAETLARQHKDELGRLAAQATGGTAQAMRDLAGNFDILGGASASAEERARAQERALRDMAATASGPLRTELLRMADQIRTLPSGSFTVTADGRLGQMFNPDGSFKGSAGRLATGGVWAGPGRTIRAATGTVLPGYTPGRDVHRFVSPTGGRLDLSGGEAVLRPEVTNAVTPAWVHGANKAARAGGVAGVQNFLARTGPRPTGVEGRAGDGSRFAHGGVIGGQRFAFGGIVRRGPAYSALVSQDHRGTAEAAANRMTPALQAAIRRFEDAAQAAAASSAAGGAASGPVTAGANAGLSWARTQAGKPYVWGAVGPRGYDCSGFMSAIVNVMRGRNPHSRLGGTGTFPWPGFRPGIGPGLSIGSFRGNPGHMAGTIGGVNVESRGSAGVLVGAAARGAGHSMFTTKAHLADRGGIFRSGEAALNLSGRAERALTGQQNETFERFVTMLTGPRGRDYMRVPGQPTVAPPTGGGAEADRARALMSVARPAMAAQTAIDIAPLAREVARLGAELRGRPPVVVNQNFPGGGRPSQETRDAGLGIRMALG